VAGRTVERRGWHFPALNVTTWSFRGTVSSVPFDTTFRSVIANGLAGVTPAADAPLPGSRGERLLQYAYGTEQRAARFYADQVRDRLLPEMIDFVARMEMVFVASSDSGGECDASLRSGPPGFIQVLDDGHLAYPEYRGNGVHASLGNISENPHVGLLMLDFVRDLIGLHVNGRARVVDDAELRALHPALPADGAPGRRAERWVVIAVDEAYVHCRKHIPRMARVAERREWGTDDPARKGGDYFGARAERLTREGDHAEGATGKIAPGEGAAAEAVGGAPAIPMARQHPRPPFPSTAHLPAGSATARPLRPVSRSRQLPPRRARRRIRWLSS
jgi:predicted pyridoxine 5'-phosphate oxidase superfamily flavin-nucleotide-binding protein